MEDVFSSFLGWSLSYSPLAHAALPRSPRWYVYQKEVGHRESIILQWIMCSLISKFTSITKFTQTKSLHFHMTRVFNVYIKETKS